MKGGRASQSQQFYANELTKTKGKKGKKGKRKKRGGLPDMLEWNFLSVTSFVSASVKSAGFFSHNPKFVV